MAGSTAFTPPIKPLDDHKIAVWFSCGAASAVAAHLTLQRFPNHEVLIANNPVAEEDPDNRRFLADVSEWIGRPILDVRHSSFPDARCDSVWKRERGMVFPHGAPCTRYLKKYARQEWEQRHRPDWHVLGFTAEERKRHDRFVLTERSNVIPVLIEAGLTKDDCADIIRQAGIELPAAYRRGYPIHVAACDGAQRLRPLAAKASEGPWRAESLDTEDGYGACLSSQIVRPDGKTVLDALNSDVACMAEESDEDGRRRWDEQGEADAAYVEALDALGRRLMSSTASNSQEKRHG